MSKCFVQFPDDNLPFIIKSTVLLLSSFISVLRSYPSSIMKLFVNCTVGNASSIAMNSVSVEILVFTFCLFDQKKTQNNFLQPKLLHFVLSYLNVMHKTHQHTKLISKDQNKPK
jgi:hypothetical protein